MAEAGSNLHAEFVIHRLDYLDEVNGTHYANVMPVRYAGFWIRALAHGMDSLVLTVGSIVLQLMIYGAIYWVQFLIHLRTGDSMPGFSDAFNPFVAQVVNTVLYLGLAAPYYIVLHWKRGATWGKRICKVKVVQFGAAQGEDPITLKQSILRFGGYLVSYLPFMAGFFMAGLQPHKRGLHDLIGGTVSIRDV